ELPRPDRSCCEAETTGGEASACCPPACSRFSGGRTPCPKPAAAVPGSGRRLRLAALRAPGRAGAPVSQGVCPAAFTGRTVWWFICWSERRGGNRKRPRAAFRPLFSFAQVPFRRIFCLFTVSLKWIIYAPLADLPGGRHLQPYGKTSFLRVW